MPDPLRLFVAVFPPAILMSALGAFVRDLRQVPGLDHVRWVRPENLHFTIKFLGNVPRERLIDAARALSRETGRLELCKAEPDTIRLQEVEIFPRRRPRVIAAIPDAAGRELLTHDAHRIEEAFRDFGFPREGRPFKAHLTLGRFNRPPRTAEWKRFPSPPAEPWAEPEQLVMSELLPTGPRYRRLLSACEEPTAIRLP